MLSNLQTDPDLSLLLALHAVNTSLTIEEPVPAETVEALHLAVQANGIQYYKSWSNLDNSFTIRH